MFRSKNSADIFLIINITKYRVIDTVTATPQTSHSKYRYISCIYSVWHQFLKLLNTKKKPFTSQNFQKAIKLTFS